MQTSMLSMTLIPLLLLIVILIPSSLSSSDRNFTFNGFGNSSAAAILNLTGLATITSDGLLALTNDTKQAQGHAFYPVTFTTTPNSSNPSPNRTPLSFSTTFVFAIAPQFVNVSSNGITFAISPTKDLSNAMPGQYLGLFNDTNSGSPSNHILAVELDTVKNVEFGDIDDNHVGIDINGLRSFDSSSAAYFDERSAEFKPLKLISGDRMQVWIEYDGQTMQLDVTISPFNVPKPKVPLVSSKLVNLSSVLLDHNYVGFTSSTGASTGTHYILGWSFNPNGSTAPPLDLSKLPSLPRRRRNASSHQALIVALPSAAALVLILCAVGVVLGLKTRERFGEVLEDWEVEYGPHRFSYRDLYNATKGFKEQNQVGIGGFGRVYKGVLQTSGIEVAVKRISHDSSQGVREFIAEIASLGRVRHRNLVPLLGYCRRRGELLLVYDFMPNGSLDRFLFDRDQANPNQQLSWTQRFNIIKGVASGLLYLHQEWEQVVIHRDIKASNVLLDGEMNARLGDFGLARLYDHGSNLQTTHIVGTLGYLAPELSRTGRATTKTDVYAFGAFMLEVACGRRPLEVRDRSGEPVLVDRVLDYWKKGVILEARDPKLGCGDACYVEGEVELVLKLGLYCSHHESVGRPSMKQVVQFLEGDAPLPEICPEGLKSRFSGQQYYDLCFDDLKHHEMPLRSGCVGGDSIIINNFILS